MPPGMSRPSSRTDQHPGHMRRTSSNLAPQHVQGQMPQPNYAYTPNPPFYNPQAAGQGRPPPYPPPQGQPPPGQATYPPPNLPPQAPPQHPHVQQMIVQDNRRSSMPPAFPAQQPVPGQAPQANMQRNPSEGHLQPPPQHPPRMGSPQPPSRRHTPSPQPPQQPTFQSPPMPQPKALPAQAKHNIFTPIDDSRSMLAANWGQTSNAEAVRSEPAIKMEGGPRSASIDVAQMQRDRPGARSNGASPRPPPARTFHSKSPQPPRPGGRASVPNVPPPTRQNTNQSDAKRPKLNLQIPAEHSEGEATASALEEGNTAQPGNTAGGQHQGPAHGVVLPPPSPSAGALLSAGAQGPPNPFARPAPPMSTNPHAMNRDANHIETPISALPSRFMSDNLLPSPSTFYPEWGFGRSNDSNMLPSPLNFQTPVVGNGQGWREDERKRPTEDDAGGDSKRSRT